MEIDESSVGECSCGETLHSNSLHYCQNCTTNIGERVRGEIKSLKQKLELYSQCESQFEKFLSDTKLNSAQSQNSKMIDSNSKEFEKRLENELLGLNEQLQKEQKLYEKLQIEFQEQIKSLGQVEQMQSKLHRRYRELSENKENFTYKLSLASECCQKLETTDFVSSIYSMTFEDDQPYLNGERIDYENAWKLLQIVRFYHLKYSKSYNPVLNIEPDTMTIFPVIDFFAPKTMFYECKGGSLEIKGDDEDQIQKWVPYLNLEVKNLFAFLTSGLNASQYQQNYEIDEKTGEFVVQKPSFRQKQLQGNIEPPSLNNSKILKALMSNISQLNRLQFMLKEKRFSESQHKHRKESEDNQFKH